MISGYNPASFCFSRTYDGSMLLVLSPLKFLHVQGPVLSIFILNCWSLFVPGPHHTNHSYSGLSDFIRVSPSIPNITL